MLAPSRGTRQSELHCRSGCRREGGGIGWWRSLRFVATSQSGVGAPAETTPWHRIARRLRTARGCSRDKPGSTRSKQASGIAYAGSSRSCWVMLKRSQSHPRHVPGRLTIPQLAAQLGVSAHWIYDRVHNGAIAITRDEHTGLYLFPDAPSTLDRLQKLRAGELERLAFDAELGS